MKKSSMKPGMFLFSFMVFLQICANGNPVYGDEHKWILKGAVDLITRDKGNSVPVMIGQAVIPIKAAEIKASNKPAGPGIGERPTDSRDTGTFTEMTLLGCLLVIGIYSLILFIVTRKETVYAWFGILCLLSCIKIALISHVLIPGFLHAPGSGTLNKAGFITYALFPPLFAAYLKSLFGKEFRNAVIRILWAAAIVSCIMAILIPQPFYIRITRLYDLLSLGVGIYSFIMVATAGPGERKGSYIILAGIALICLGLLYDIIFRHGAASGAGAASYAFLAFLILQIWLISSRLMYSYRTVIDTSGNLRIKSNELEKSKNLLECIFNTLTSPILAVDSTFFVTEMNASARGCIYKDTEDEISGRKLWEMIPVKDEYKRALEDAVKTGISLNLRGERIIKDDNRLFNVSINPLSGLNSEGAVILADDVTETSRKDEQIKQAQKMETIGVLAGGLAHDFNNALGGILSTVTLMKYCIREGIEENRIPERVSMIERAAKNAADLVGRFLHLTKKHDVLYMPVELNATVQHVAKICRDTFDKSIDINTGYLLEDAFIMADELQIEHVLLNLCINASQAMTTMRERNENIGGVLDISIGSINETDDFFKTHRDIQPQELWTVSVSDTGVGMDSDKLARVFEPFYSTKESGTGLGLVMVESIIREHGGFIDVRSVKGKGSVFMLYFKKYTGAVPVTETSKTPVKKEFEAGGTILLAEDDVIIRDMARELLEGSGYDVIEASNGEEALNIFRQRYFEITGVFMDNAMPLMSGVDAFIAMKEIDPDVKVLLTSGFAHDPAVKDAMEKGAAGFLRKPYSMHELLAKAREVFT
jgi:signal transduction histidine kinase